MNALEVAARNAPTAAATALALDVALALVMPIFTVQIRGIGLNYFQRALAIGVSTVPITLSIAAFLVIAPTSTQLPIGPLARTLVVLVGWGAAFGVIVTAWNWGLDRFTATRRLLIEGSLLINGRKIPKGA